MRKLVHVLSASAASFVLGLGLILPAFAATYEYDALGRLIKVTPDSGNPVCYTYDLADNRTAVSTTCSGGGGGGGGHPVTVDDDAFGWFACPYDGSYEWVYVDPLSNDYDTGGGYLTLTNVSGSYTSIFYGGVLYYGPAIYGTLQLTYTVMNSAGASATGTITIYSYQMDC